MTQTWNSKLFMFWEREFSTVSSFIRNNWFTLKRILVEKYTLDVESVWKVDPRNVKVFVSFASFRNLAKTGWPPGIWQLVKTEKNRPASCLSRGVCQCVTCLIRRRMLSFSQSVFNIPPPQTWPSRSLLPVVRRRARWGTERLRYRALVGVRSKLEARSVF